MPLELWNHDKEIEVYLDRKEVIHTLSGYIRNVCIPNIIITKGINNMISLSSY